MVRTKKLFGIILSIFLLMTLAAGVASAAKPTESTFLVVVSGNTPLTAAMQSARDAGLTVRHTFPPDAFIVVSRSAAVPSISGATVFHSPADVPPEASATAQLAAQAWRELSAPRVTARTAAALDSRPLHAGDFADAFIPAEPPARQLLSVSATDPRPGYTESSQFLAGSIAVGIVFPESNGATDPSTEDWTSAEISQVAAEVASALNWWEQRNPAANISVVYDVGSPVATSVEPISRPYSDQQIWIAETMTAMGYSGTSYFDQVRQYNDHLRQTFGTDWAFTIFVANSANDSDNRFSDGHFAYAYLGGPFMVMTSGNNGYGIGNMDAVAAHEMGHIFRALDQYASANVSCTAVSGYLQVENQNSQQGCASDVPSIMRGQITPFANGDIDEYAAGQIGWADGNANGVPDAVDAGLRVSGIVTTTNTATNVFTVTARAEETPFPSPKYRDVLINSLTAINFAVDGGAWQAAQPTDDTIDNYFEDFSFTTGPLAPGTHTISVQTVDNFGKINTATLTTVTVTGTEPVDTQFAPPTNRTLSPSAATAVDGSAVQLETGVIVGVEYRVDGGTWQAAQPADGNFDSASEGFTIALDTANLSPGSHTLEARAQDNVGNVDLTPASMSVAVQGAYSIFLPLIVR